MKKLLAITIAILGIASFASAETTIDGLPSASSITGTEVVAISQATVAKKTTVQDIANLAGAVPAAANYFDFNLDVADPAYQEARFFWNDDDNTLNIYPEIDGPVLQVGQEMWVKIVNKTGGILYDGDVVYVDDAQGNRPTVALADADAEATSKVVGLVTFDIADNAEGYVTTFGYVRGFDTSVFTEGDALYLSSTAGDLTATPPVPPAHEVFVGFALNSTADGDLLIKPGVHTIHTPASSTDNAISRFNGTEGDALQNSGVTIDDSNNMAGGVWIGTAIADAYVADDITITNITQITNRSHTSLTDIGTDTHATIDTFIDNGIIDVFDCTSGDCNSITVQSGESLEVAEGGEVEATEVVIHASNDTGATIYKCSAVHIHDYDIPSVLPEIVVADSDDGLLMPAIGIAYEDIADGASGRVMISGLLSGADLNTGEVWVIGDSIYVNASGTSTSDDCGETLTKTRPTGVSSGVQKIGVVIRDHGTLGKLAVIGAGRSNDVPNLEDAKFWLGNGTNVATQVAMSGDVTLDNLGEATVANDSHTHGTSSLAGIDIGDDTNLAGTANEITLTGDTLSLHTDNALDSELHAESHSVASHSDTTITGTETETLSDGSDANSLHYHGVTTKTAATDYTIGTTDTNEKYGGVIYVTGAATITIPAVASGISFTVITIGATAVSVDPNASDKMYLDGVLLDDGDKATNTSTTGDTLVCSYFSADGWYCMGGSPDGDPWTDGS